MIFFQRAEKNAVVK